jgi:hypothetical protein
MTRNSSFPFEFGIRMGSHRLDRSKENRYESKDRSAKLLLSNQSGHGVPEYDCQAFEEITT